MRGQPQHVERAEQIHAHGALERLLRHRTVAPDDAAGGADAGAVDDDPQRSVRVARLLDRGEHRGLVGHVAFRRDAADFRGDGPCAGGIAIEDGNARAARGEGARGGRAESGCAAGNDGGVIVNVHQPIAITAGWSSDV
jgi:hypothetical protein